MNRTRIAVAGAGVIGLRHIEEIVASGSAALAAVVDVSPRRARSRARRVSRCTPRSPSCSRRTGPTA